LKQKVPNSSMLTLVKTLEGENRCDYFCGTAPFLFMTGRRGLLEEKRPGK